MAVKAETRNGHELSPLNVRLTDDGAGVTVVLTPAGSVAQGNEERASWDNKMQFMLSIIGYSVGLGNIWRFPYLCQQNGGGAFLIPFLIMLVLEGVPLFLIELGIGQKMRLGSLGVWNTIHPWLGGLGIASCTVTFFVALYYNVIITWCFYYLFNSFQYPLPWASCPRLENGSAVPECEKSSETAYFWYRTTLDVSPSMEDSGGLKWWIVLCLLLAWSVVFCIVMKGIQSSGKVVYFTSMFPYIVLTIFFIRGITLKGASAGLVHMYTPKIDMLLNPNVWLDAATQVFYSFGLAFGSLIAFGSYNPPKNNCVRDVILVSTTNALTAIYASVVVFAILGFKARANVDKCIFNLKLTDPIAANSTEYLDEHCSLAKQLDQAAEGTGLAFIVFTQAIVELPGAPFWAIIFFLMLLSLGIGSQIGILEGMLSCIFDIDFFKRIRKQYLTGFVCITCFCVGLIFATGAGEYWLKLFDSFAGTIGLVMIALLEMIAVMFIYGHEKFTQDIEDMTGYRPGPYWQITWRFLAPVIMTCILVSSIVFRILNKNTYMAWDANKGETVETEYPDWVMVVAILMVCASIFPIFAVFLLRRFQCLKLDVDIHQGAIRRIDTTVSTKEMMADVDLDEYHDDSEDEDEEDCPPSRQRLGKTFKMEVMDF
ncbi:sodium- and chloride-dependent transporter XTRP3 isoform X1 [Nilaparvata lugens]|uniref:sodium- and chloride-dependent transporter XTRP3 isoform X1 n=1 Tax=Nilaparvata lugens TaxID=108931 RepID=UPI00193E57BC|nr:sodium- and chloride-dependent transporter XTRP3 isoform X1 [Nilaparvata lugens]